MSEQDDGVRIQAIRGEDGQLRYVVYLAGTVGLDPSKNRSWGDNLAGINNVRGLTETYIRERMKQIPYGSEIMLVGYSQGGIHAQNLAASGDYIVTDVVTFGSPDVPSSEPQIYGANILSITDPRDPVPYASVGLVHPEGLAQSVYSLLHQETNGDVELFVHRPDTRGGVLDPDVHTNRETYLDAGRAFDDSDNPRYAEVKESISRYDNGAVVSDSSSS